MPAGAGYADLLELFSLLNLNGYCMVSHADHFCYLSILFAGPPQCVTCQWLFESQLLLVSFLMECDPMLVSLRTYYPWGYCNDPAVYEI